MDRIDTNWFFIYMAPVPYRRMNYKGKWTENNKAYHKYMQAIQWDAKKEGFIPSGCMEIMFFLPIPKSWSKKKKKEMVDTPHRQTPDLDNLVKGVLDALFYKSGGDQHVYAIRAEKYWADAGMILIRNSTRLVNLE